jgi:hypothetical protein
MAHILDQTPREVTVHIYVDGKPYDSFTNREVPAYAVPYVAMAAVVQVQDPDLEMAEDSALEHSDED